MSFPLKSGKYQNFESTSTHTHTHQYTPRHIHIQYNTYNTMSRLEAMTIESAAQTSSKRKNAPKEDEGEDEGDDSGSDGGSDVVCLSFQPYLSTLSPIPLRI